MTQNRWIRLLDDHGVPAHIRRHSEAVARLARRLAGDLALHSPFAPDTSLVEAAALLHDIAKEDCLHSALDHAVEGGRVLRAMGLDDIASLVEQHIDLGPSPEPGSVTEAEILNYSDKRVLHERIVSLDERFRDLHARYGNNDPALQGIINSRRRSMKALEEKIFRHLPYGPDSLDGSE